MRRPVSLAESRVPVYFVYRSHYDSPSGKRLARFEDDTLLGWFRSHWPTIAKGDVGDLLGFGVYGFGSLFGYDIEVIPPPPATDEELANYVQGNLYSEGPILTSPHLITVQTDDDELEVAYYIFDGHYLEEYGDRASFLLHEGWQLPGGSADGPFEPTEPAWADVPTGQGEGDLYWACEAFQDSSNFENMGPATRIKGVHVADLARYLARNEPSDMWSDYWLLLRTQLFAEGATSEPLEASFREALLDDPDDEATWAAYSDWLQERDLPPAGLIILERALHGVAHYPLADLDGTGCWNVVRTGTVRQARAALEAAFQAYTPHRHRSHDPAKSCIHVEEHLAQLCVHVARWDRTDLYQQWIFFDDRWGAAHPDLANSILRFTRCWDMLSPDGPSDEEV
jgi:uncharacterized protein (TIGR02996 family)